MNTEQIEGRWVPDGSPLDIALGISHDFLVISEGEITHYLPLNVHTADWDDALLTVTYKDLTYKINMLGEKALALQLPNHPGWMIFKRALLAQRG
jgi:hypothetical protein